MDVTITSARTILTRTTGYLDGVASHSLQPYRGCSYGRSLCGVGCYVRHNYFVTRGRAWGEFLEVRANAAELYRKEADRERAWARRRRGRFGIFCSSSTDPFVPQERRYGITRSLLEAMLDRPPDGLILQTHTHLVLDARGTIAQLARHCDLRVHMSIETDREEMEGLPPHASPIAKRIEACRELRSAGIRVVVTIAPLLPIADPDQFFSRLAAVADAVVIDHFIEGDGSSEGARTRQTPLPLIMENIHPGSASLDYREKIAAVARDYFPGRVGIGKMGFAGVFD